MASNPAGKFKLELTPLPTRVSRLAVDRLNNLRDYDGMTIQEHVRRAVDEYLDRLEAKYQKKLPPPPWKGKQQTDADTERTDPLVVPTKIRGTPTSIADIVGAVAPQPTAAAAPSQPALGDQRPKASRKPAKSSNPYAAVKAG